MKPATRPLLTLPGRGLIDPAEDRTLPIGVYDVLLPCRKFRIDHKVAVLGRVSLTAEFLLRLLRSLEGLAEQDAAAFFGFDRREMSYVLGEVEELGFVERREGRLWLTMQGHSLFRDGSPHPEIFDVEKRSETVGFDLLSLAPQQIRFLENFERRLPELSLVDAGQVSSAASRIPQSFRRFYSELASRREQPLSGKKSLYSIDAVSAVDRFQSTVRIVLAASGMQPSRAEVDLDEWRPDHEQDDRKDIRVAASAFRDGLLTSRRPEDGEAYRTLIDLAPNFLKEFTRADGLSVERYYREAFTRAGEPRADRPTIPLLGSLFLHDNLRRLTEVLAYGLKAQGRPNCIVWTVPQVPHWGATALLPSVLRQLVRAVGHPAPDRAGPVNRTVCVVAGKEGRHLEDAFALVTRIDSPVLPRSLEILLVPGILAAAAVHAPIGANSGLAVPLGLISFDPAVLERARELLLNRCANILPVEISDELDRSLALSPTSLAGPSLPG